MGHKAGFTQQGELVQLHCPVGGRGSLWKRLLGERRLKLSLWESEEEFKKGETARMKDWRQRCESTQITQYSALQDSESHRMSRTRPVLFTIRPAAPASSWQVLTVMQ